jgi:hypothetical protein
MKQQNKSKIKTLAELLVTGAIFSGTIYGCEKLGISQSFEDYNKMVCHASYEGHKRYPLVVWGHYGNPENITEDFRKYQRVVMDGLLGLLGIGSSVALFNVLRDRKKNSYLQVGQRIKH